MSGIKKRISLSDASIERLARLYTLLAQMADDGRLTLSSAALAELTGVPDHTLRKDISALKTTAEFASGATERGYDAARLASGIAAALGMDRPRRACLVGLGSLGTGILRKLESEGGPYRLAAAFDTSQNRRELLSTRVPLHPARDITRICAELAVEIGIIAVPAPAAQDTADRLVAGGVRGLVNYASALVRGGPAVVRNLSLAGELNVIAARFGAQGV